MEVGDRVVFSGPAYRFSPRPAVGEKGTVIEKAGHWWSTEPDESERSGELVTVMFDGHDRPTVLDINRLTVVEFVTPKAAAELLGKDPPPDLPAPSLN